MKAHISNSETEMKLAIETKLLEVRQAGLAAGAKAISSVVYEKATDKTKTYEERIDDIKKFCEVGLSVKKNTKKEYIAADKERAKERKGDT